MIDRRVFMHGAAGVAATFASVLPGARAGLAAGPGGVAPDVALVDRHLDGSGSFAAQARARGVTPYEFSSDAAGVWMRELEPRLRTGPVAVEGYTSAATLFCLELLARDYGARVARRSETPAGVVWIMSSKPMQRAPLAPRPLRSAVHA